MIPKDTDKQSFSQRKSQLSKLNNLGKLSKDQIQAKIAVLDRKEADSVQNSGKKVTVSRDTTPGGLTSRDSHG